VSGTYDKKNGGCEDRKDLHAPPLQVPENPPHATGRRFSYIAVPVSPDSALGKKSTKAARPATIKNKKFIFSLL